MDWILMAILCSFCGVTEEGRFKTHDQCNRMVNVIIKENGPVSPYLPFPAPMYWCEKENNDQ